MEMIREFLFASSTRLKPLPFPNYLLRQNIMRNGFWITIEGEVVYPHDMEGRHLLNTIRLLHRSNPNLEDKYRRATENKDITLGLHGIKKPKMKGPLYDYYHLWKSHYTYMCLRRELVLRGMENLL